MKPVIILIIYVFTQALSGTPSNQFQKQRYPSRIARDVGQEELTGRVVGGEDVPIEEFPWQASISYEGEHVCGGSILTKNHILTAAHCVQGMKVKHFWVTVGTDYLFKGGRNYKIIHIKSHPEFNFTTLDYDAAIMELETPLKLSDKVAPVDLPTKSFFKSVIPGRFVTVSGFGKTSEDGPNMSAYLQATDVPIVSIKECQKRIKDFVVTKNMLCAGYTKGVQDACGGDSGGPLTLEGFQIGVVSWGIGCAVPGVPGVYTSILSIMDFIETVI